MLKWILIIVLILSLSACDGDDASYWDGGKWDESTGGDYETYHDVQEVLSRRGYVGFMVLALFILIGGKVCLSNSMRMIPN